MSLPASTALDAVFSALSDSTRRKVLACLTQGSVPVTELAKPHDMSLPGFMKHLRVLEVARLIICSKEGRVVRCSLAPAPMKEAAAWMARYENFWNERLDALGRYMYHRKELTPWQAKSTSGPRSLLPASTTRARKKSGVRGPTRKR